MQADLPGDGQKDQAYLIRCTLDVPQLVRKIVQLSATISPLAQQTKSRRDTDLPALEAKNPWVEELLSRMNRVDLGSELVNAGSRLYWSDIGKQIIEGLMNDGQLKSRMGDVDRVSINFSAYLIDGKPQWQTTPVDNVDAKLLANFSLNLQDLRDRKPNPITYVNGGTNDVYPYILDGMNRAASARYEAMFPNPFNSAASIRHVSSSEFLSIGKMEKILICPDGATQPTVCRPRIFQGDGSWLRGHSGSAAQSVADIVGATKHEAGWIGVVASGHLDSEVFKKAISDEIQSALETAKNAITEESRRIQIEGVNKATVPEARVEIASRIYKVLNPLYTGSQQKHLASIGKSYVDKTLLLLAKYAEAKINEFKQEAQATSETPQEAAASCALNLIEELMNQGRTCLEFNVQDAIAKASLEATNTILGELSYKITGENSSQRILQQMKLATKSAHANYFLKSGGSLVSLVVQDTDGTDKQLTLCSIGQARVYRIRPSGEIVELTFHSLSTSHTLKMHSISLVEGDQVIVMTEGAVNILRNLSISPMSPRQDKPDPVIAERERVELINSLQEALTVSGSRNFIDFFRSTLVKIYGSSVGSRRGSVTQAPESFALLRYPSPLQ